MNALDPCDLLIIGGGINGAGIARDAAGRGLKVVLCDKGDLAGATSSASTKLIHGGLRYLETFDLRLVREALAERETLLAMAPHIVHPMRFLLPHNSAMRPAWMIRLGLFAYDRLSGRRRLAASRQVDLRHSPMGEGLKAATRRGFVYSDCTVDDARLVVLNAVGAAEHGARIMTYTECTGAQRRDGLWRARLRSAGGGDREIIARAIVNATGPWVDRCRDKLFGKAGAKALRLVKGSHVVVPRLYPGHHALVLQNPDRRVVFVIPFEQAFSLIGTTEVDYRGDPGAATVSDREVDYLCAGVNRYLAKPVAPKDVCWRFAGVRPLHQDGAASASRVSRDYQLAVDGEPPLLSVTGGKITTYRRLAEQAVALLIARLGRPPVPPWTAGAPLPGGDIENGDLNAFTAEFAAARPWLGAELARRLARTYGSRAADVLAGAGGLDDLGADLGHGLHAVEVDYLRRREWARSAEDILWRRTKLGLRADPRGVRNLSRWLARP